MQNQTRYSDVIRSLRSVFHKDVDHLHGRIHFDKVRGLITEDEELELIDIIEALPRTVHLQGIGKVRGKQARDIKVGDVVSFNYQYAHAIVSEIIRETGCFIFYKVQYRESGDTYDVRRRKDAWVAIETMTAEAIGNL